MGRLSSLINMGERVLSTRHRPAGNVYSGDAVGTALFQQWRTSSLALLESVFGDNGVHYQEYKEKCKGSWYFDSERGLAILKAAKEDIEGGCLQRIESLVSASVFSDFLEMAEYLLDEGYKDPTASLVGAVLEDGLRRICTKNGITVKTREDLSSLNQKLTAKRIYNPLQQKQIQVWNEIRNNADHGKFDEYKTQDVSNMLKGARGFLANYLT